MALDAFVVSSVVLAVLFGLNYTDGTNLIDYFEWQSGSGPPLYCPDRCTAVEDPGRCCACGALPCWDLQQNSTNTSVTCGVTKEMLYIERTNVHGVVYVVNPFPADLYELTVKQDFLIKIPGNICDFASSLVKLDLSFNKLVDISPLKCLTELDTLHLDYNLIKEVDNTTFSNMTKLRVLTMRGNKLENMPPNLIKTGDRNVFTVDFSSNQFLYKVDITNIFREGIFCVLDMSETVSNQIVNELNHRANQSAFHGPGEINFERSEISFFPNITAVGLNWNSHNVLGRIRIDESSIRCDCNIYPYATASLTEFLTYWDNLATFTCNSPDKMKGENLTSILMERQFDKLTCDLENCPYQGLCHCIDNPDANKIIVNCTNAGLDEFPDEMPVGFWDNKNIHLILVGNKIKEIPNRYYMDRLVGLDLRRNYLSVANPNAVRNIFCPVNIEDQRLTNLIQEFGVKDPNNFEFGNNPFKCDCTNLWIRDWIRVGNALKRLRCELNDGRVMWAENVTSDVLDCNIDIIPVVPIVVSSVVVISLILVIAGLWYIFKYDISVYTRKWTRRQPRRRVCYDAFISFCEDDNDAFTFVKDYLRPGLRCAGYTMFTPWFNMHYSGDRDAAVTENIEHCSNYIVVLTKAFLHDYNGMFEFDCIWKNFKSDKCTQIVLINLDFLESKEIKDKRIETFRRTNTDISFRDRNDTLLGRLKDRLGAPRVRHECQLQRSDKCVEHQRSNDRFNDLREVRETYITRQHYVQQLEKDAYSRHYFSMPVHKRMHNKI